MKKSRLFIPVLLAMLLPTITWAIPVKFTYTTTVTFDSGSISGVTNGDTLTLDVVADNGNTDLISGVWFQTDVISAVARIEGYEAVFNYPHFDFDPVFETDALGSLITTRWYDVDTNNTDNLGSGSPTFSTNALYTSDRSALLVFDIPATHNNVIAWEVSIVPIPASVWLFGSGMLGLIGAGRKKSA